MADIPFNDIEPIEDPMSESFQLRRDLETLKESMRLDWVQMAKHVMTPEECQDLRAHIDACIAHLSEVLARLDKSDADRA